MNRHWPFPHKETADHIFFEKHSFGTGKTTSLVEVKKPFLPLRSVNAEHGDMELREGRDEMMKIWG